MCKFSRQRHIKEIPNKTFGIYPNPVTGHLNVLSTDVSRRAVATLLDVNGNVVKTFSLQEEHTVIDISMLTPGVYMVCFENNAEKTWQKVIKL